MLMVSGCARKLELSIDYVPQNSASVSGAVKVETFVYNLDPALAGNEFESSATDLQAFWSGPSFSKKNLFLDRPIGSFYAKAVDLEFRKAGISSRFGRPCRLTGEITRWRSGLLGADTFIFEISAQMYLQSPNGARIYSARHESSSEEDGYFIVQGMTSAVSQTIIPVLQDPDFQGALAAHCPRVGG